MASHILFYLFSIMPLSVEAQREEKVIAKQAAADDKVRNQVRLRSGPAYSVG